MASLTNLPENASAAAAFESTLWANGPAMSDAFYLAPPNTHTAEPGTLLKLEVNTDTSNFALPPSVAMSRIIYQSQTYQGTSVPASAYILWPYQARTLSDGAYPVVAWAHGTSGLYENCASSNLKNLWHHLMLRYVTVAPDYAALGVGKTADGQEIGHQFVANPAHANDVFYAVQAAQAAFHELSSEFVVVGHSQGGGAAWGAAQRQAVRPVKGYLGAIAISPVTNVLELPDNGNPLIPVLGAFMAPSIKSLFPEFYPKDVFTDIGWERFQAYSQARGCNPVAVELLTGIQLLKEDWTKNSFVQKYVQLTSNGGKKIGGPLLVIQGDADPNMNIATTTRAVDKLVQGFPESQVEFVRLPGITHTPALYASQRLWLDWIDARFAGVRVEDGYKHSEASKFPRPLASYQSDATWIITVPSEAFQLS